MAREEPIRGDIIKKSFDELDVLGQPLKEEIIAFIERRGNPLDSNHYYSLKEIRLELGVVFGDDAALLITERLKRGMRAIKSLAIVAVPAAGLVLWHLMAISPV